MFHRAGLALGLSACFFLLACNSGPGKSGSPSPKGAPSAAERKVEYLTALTDRRGDAGRAWNAVAAALPDGVWLTEAAYDAGKVRIKGRTASNNLLADYISRLGESPGIANLALGGTALKTVRGREVQEFSLTAQAAPGPENAAGPDELERELGVRPDTAAILREVQRLALDSGFKMTKFTPGAEVPGEFAGNISITVEASGDKAAVRDYLGGWAGLPGLWIIDKVSLKAAFPDDPKSPVRISISARAYFRP